MSGDAMYQRTELFIDGEWTAPSSGTVVEVVSPHTEQVIVAIANDSDFALAGAVFTADSAHGLAIAARVRAGSFGVNEGYIMDPLAPYGGLTRTRPRGTGGLPGEPVDLGC
jgi:acyl-CoA reductase-like NAD-dependent aldehyde dehydrogenase